MENSTEIKKINIAELKEAAIMAAMAAGEELKSGFTLEKEIQEKTGHHDLVTQYDSLSEKTILNLLKSKFPTHGFITEESGEIGTMKETIIWCIDPLDGTWNFAHNIPTFSISIAALFLSEPIIGIIYHPLLSELFVAEKGKGASLNGKSIHVSSVDYLLKAGLSFGLSLHAKEDLPWVVDRIRDLTKQHIMIRRTGSAALDLAYVAAGRLDGFFEPALNNWDVAAGALLVKEAGGTITTLDGEKLNFRKKQSILGANKHIHKQLLTFFKLNS
jgi:myo-inositol-1(or 4)-monophosphatase